jgi:hypothetical protein
VPLLAENNRRTQGQEQQHTHTSINHQVTSLSSFYYLTPQHVNGDVKER